MTRVEGILRNRRYTYLKGGKSKAITLSTWLCVNYPGGGGGGEEGGNGEVNLRSSPMGDVNSNHCVSALWRAEHVSAMFR